MKMTRDLLKKIGDIKRTFHARIGMMKDRNGKVLTEVAEIRKKWQGYTEELYKQGLNDLDNYDVVTHLEMDILECEVRWASGNISTNKGSRSDGIPAELFEILKDDAVKVLHSICQQIGKLISRHRTGKGQFSVQSLRKAMPKNAQTTTQLQSFHMLERLYLKSSKLGFSSM